jgi:SAM-dependent methyltransferase
VESSGTDVDDYYTEGLLEKTFKDKDCMEFDAYKDCYRQEVQKAIAFTGTDVDYYTEAKATALLEVCQRRLGGPRELEALDVGCGVGLTDEYLAPTFRGLYGVDVSAQCLEEAARRNPGARYQVYDGNVLPFPDGRFDVVFAINVLHHVKPGAWQQFVDEMRRVTRPSGIAVVFEHNPYNPLTRLVVSRCAFDADAVLLSPRRTSALILRAHFEVIDRRFILFIPFRSRALQAVERRLGWLPLGGQYYVVGRAPAGTGHKTIQKAA